MTNLYNVLQVLVVAAAPMRKATNQIFLTPVKCPGPHCDAATAFMSPYDD
jgi:hypothetical protein